jgi:predicted RNA-binding protein with PIN domain
MTGRIVIIDAYNVIYRVPSLRAHLRENVDKAREVLVRYCLEWKMRRNDVSLFQIVFDGSPSGSSSSTFRARNVQVLYPALGETADDRIIALLRGADEGTEYVVVSDDNEIRDVARAQRAEVLAVREFYSVLSRKRDARQQREAEEDSKDSLTPNQIKEINDDLLREWGLE